MSDSEQVTSFIEKRISDTIKDIEMFLQPFREFNLHGAGVESEVDFLIGAAVAHTLSLASSIFLIRYKRKPTPQETTIMRDTVFKSVDRFESYFAYRSVVNKNKLVLCIKS